LTVFKGKSAVWQTNLRQDGKFVAKSCFKSEAKKFDASFEALWKDAVIYSAQELKDVGARPFAALPRAG
jgi:hypothetical protein